ncbi:MAG TPA: hypothetical protein VFE78_36490 [Gemmataceae bacterium]|jgi:hypothetical protein|nr:hypothetical protein [Gemmataceae bacterium]
MRYLAVFATLALLVFLSPLFCGVPQVHELAADRASTRHERELQSRPDRPAPLPLARAPEGRRR